MICGFMGRFPSGGGGSTFNSISEDGSGNVVIADGKNILLDQGQWIGNKDDATNNYPRVELFSGTEARIYASLSGFTRFSSSQVAINKNLNVAGGVDINMGAGGQINADDGTEGAPGLAVGEATSGFYLSATGDMRWSEAGSGTPFA